MKTYSVKVYCERTCWDHAFVVVKARSEAAAKRLALKQAKAGLPDDDGTGWEPAESETYESTGKYDVGDAEEVPDDEA